MPKKNFGKLDTHTPATGKLGSRTVEIAAHKTKAQQGFLHLGLGILTLLYGYTVRQRSHLFDKRRIGVRFIVGSRRQLGRHAVEFGMHVLYMRKHLADLVGHRC